MRISLAASVPLLAPILVACDQPISPTSPTPSSSAVPSISSVGAAGTATLIGNDATAGRFTITDVPFKGTFEGVLTVSPPTEPPLLPSFIEATGNATHLGRFTLEVPHVVNALFGALYLVSCEQHLTGIAWPTGEQAAEEERTERHRGLYWEDVGDGKGGLARLFLPNYFNTFREALRQDSKYANLVGNRATVLRLLGRDSEADEHATEAEEFRP